MAIFTVGPNSTFPTIAAAMAAAGPGDTIQLEAGYSNETAIVIHSGMIITGEASSTGIVLQLGSGIATVTLAGAAPIDLLDAGDGNGIVGNDGDNIVTVAGGADAVSGGLGDDRLFVDYRLATGAVTGNSTSNVAEAGGGARLVTINGGFEDFTIWTGSGADTITTGAGDDDIRTGEGAGTITAGEGANYIVGGSGADTIVAGGGGNFVDGGDGTNTITTGNGIDEIRSEIGADTIVSGAGADRITVTGGADTADAGAGSDLLIVDYSAAVTDVTGGVTGGDLGTGYTGHLADLGVATLDFVATEQFWVTTGSGNDRITTGSADDRITTGAGNDLLNGSGGADLLTGGTGHDVYLVDNAGDAIVETVGEGFDVGYSYVDYTLAAGVSIDTLSTANWGGFEAIDLTGNELGNLIYGNDGANALTGLGGDDTLSGFGGGDTMTGGLGDDTYRLFAGDDAIVEVAGEGEDTGYAYADYALDGNASVETLSTFNWGGTEAIDLTGNAFDNRLYGNAGANVLNGGGGSDVLTGFGGADTFAFTAIGGSDIAVHRDGNVAAITDFEAGVDMIALDDDAFTGLGLGALSADAFAIGSEAGDADDRIIYNSATGALLFDADGNGAGEAVLFASLSSGLSLTASDFMVI